uniref:Uncharacterized protein n=1 Tax=viral metagenome TaxID=1070528 RepID=A0A6M3MCD5_9ZZZZ
MDTAIEPVYETPIDIKREHRRFRVYFLYLDGQTQESMASILGVHRDTIVNDLNIILNRIKERPPMDMEMIRVDTYMRMVTLRNKILTDVEKVENANSRANLYEVAAKMDMEILRRYTQPGKEASDAKSSEMGEAVVDYIREKFGPEQLQDFVEWYERRSTSKNRLKKALRS